MPRLTYTDKYLGKHITDDLEARAAAHVDALGRFPIDTNEWADRLTSIRAYMMVCLDAQSEDGDTFGIKLKSYTQEFSDLLKAAKAAQKETEARALLKSQRGVGGGALGGLLSIRIERG